MEDVSDAQTTNCGIGHDPERISCETAAELRRLRAEVDDLRADNERLVDEAADAVVRQAKFTGMTVEEGAVVLGLESPRELVIAWVWAARQMLGDAENYSETRIDFPAASMEAKAAGEVERYVFTVQRAGKLTPHDARKRAEVERDEARAQVDAVRALCKDAMRLPTMDDPRPADDRVSPRAVLIALDGATP